MKAEVLLDIPDQIAGKLATGVLERVGGVVRDPATGKVVMWLREASASPIDFRSPPIKGQNSLLSLAGNAVSILNLGATVAFGAAALAKLKKIDGELDVMQSKLDQLRQSADKLQWSVDLGFANTLAALGAISQHQEIEIVGDLKSAAKEALSSQFLEPGSHQRITRLEIARSTASKVKERLLLLAQQEMQAASEAIRFKRNSYSGFAFDGSVCKALLRLRQAITASSLCASICAEADSLYAASSMLENEHKNFSSLFRDVAKSSLNSQQTAYATLLSPSYSQFMSAFRVDSWARRYDEKVGGLFDVLDAARFPNTQDNNSWSSPIISMVPFFGSFLGRVSGNSTAAPGQWAPAPDRWTDKEDRERIQSDQTNTRAFVDLIDGIDLDLDRLLGYQAEYKAGSSMGLGIHEYREALRIDDLRGDSSLCFLSLE